MYQATTVLGCSPAPRSRDGLGLKRNRRPSTARCSHVPEARELQLWEPRRRDHPTPCRSPSGAFRGVLHVAALGSKKRAPTRAPKAGQVLGVPSRRIEHGRGAMPPTLTDPPARPKSAAPLGVDCYRFIGASARSVRQLLSPTSWRIAASHVRELLAILMRRVFGSERCRIAYVRFCVNAGRMGLRELPGC